METWEMELVNNSNEQRNALLEDQKAWLKAENARLRAALEFYANHNHWMSRVENDDSCVLIAHGPHFNHTSNGWVEAEAALKIRLTDLPPRADVGAGG